MVASTVKMTATVNERDIGVVGRHAGYLDETKDPAGLSVSVTNREL